jgi:hypothetical protein
MIWAVGPTKAGSPEGGSKDHHRQQEEDAGDLKPDDSAYAAEGAQEAANPTSNATRSLACGLTSGADSGKRFSGDLSSRGWRVASGLGAGSYALAGDAPRDANSYANSATNGLRFHFEFDGNSAAHGLLETGVGSKVEES